MGTKLKNSRKPQQTKTTTTQLWEKIMYNLKLEATPIRTDDDPAIGNGENQDQPNQEHHETQHPIEARRLTPNMARRQKENIN